MLSRGKLVQDWRQRLAAAEAEGAEQHRLKWLYRMRVRLYRYLLSCYPQGDWRADAPSIAVDETLADVLHGDTTTILDCPLDGKPAKTSGKMLAVLKSVSAAQDHPATSGPAAAKRRGLGRPVRALMSTSPRGRAHTGASPRRGPRPRRWRRADRDRTS